MNLLDETQSAKKLKLSRQTLANWRCARKGPPYSRLGSRIFYQEEDLEKFVTQKRIDPEAAVSARS